jgi:peptidoglycan/xylan/chitin deacetylase (PgdA/CDA1 family)
MLSIAFKKASTSISRNVFLNLFKKKLPPKIGIYLHHLEKNEYDSFREMILSFRNKGYTFDNPTDFLNSENKSVFLSFDDNFQDWFEALPLFEECKIRATFYCNARPFRDVASDATIQEYFHRIRYTGKSKPLSISECKEIFKAGHIIGSHTYSHLNLNALSFNQGKEEICKGKNYLEDLLGADVIHFSFPFGMPRHFNKGYEEYCASIKIKTIAYATPTMQFSEQKPFNIQRSEWNLNRSKESNLENIRIDGKWFVTITGRSPIG